MRDLFQQPAGDLFGHPVNAAQTHDTTHEPAHATGEQAGLFPAADPAEPSLFDADFEVA
jgi:hypothetical protein